MRQNGRQRKQPYHWNGSLSLRTFSPQIFMFEAFPASMHEEIFSHDYFALIYFSRTGSAAGFESDLFESI